MTVPSIGQVCDAIEETLSEATDFSQSYNELKEILTDMSNLEVYPEDGVVDRGGRSDRKTFQGQSQGEQHTILADLYALQRGPGIGEEMGALVPLIDAIWTIFKAQDTKPYFGLEGIKGFGPVSWRRVIFERGEAKYVGARFTIPVVLF